MRRLGTGVVTALVVLILSFAASTSTQAIPPPSPTNAACPGPFLKVFAPSNEMDRNDDNFVCVMALPGFANATDVTVDNNVHVPSGP